MSNTTTERRPQRFAAPAPERDEDYGADALAISTEPDANDDDTEAAIDTTVDTDHLHQLCEDMARWCATRRLYGAPRGPASLLGQLAKRTRPIRPGGPDAACSQELACLYIAMCAQPADSIDRIVFELYYLRRVINVKAAAAAIGIGRQHWYTLLRDFRVRIYAASRELIASNAAQLAALPTRGVD